MPWWLSALLRARSGGVTGLSAAERKVVAIVALLFIPVFPVPYAFVANMLTKFGLKHVGAAVGFIVVVPPALMFARLLCGLLFPTLSKAADKNAAEHLSGEGGARTRAANLRALVFYLGGLAIAGVFVMFSASGVVRSVPARGTAKEGTLSASRILPPRMAAAGFTQFPDSGPPTAGDASHIDFLRLREERSTGHLFVLQEFAYHSPKGDAASLHFHIVSATSPEALHMRDGTIRAPKQIQQKGAITIARYDCRDGHFSLVKRATLVDTDGARSNSIDYIINCN
jgi:hypothetical protein